MPTKEPLFRMAPFVKGDRRSTAPHHKGTHATVPSRTVSATDLVDAASKPSPPQEYEIGMPYARPQAAEIVEAALSAAAELAAISTDGAKENALPAFAPEACTSSDPDDELRTLVEKWANLPREIQVAIMGMVSDGQPDPRR